MPARILWNQSPMYHHKIKNMKFELKENVDDVVMSIHDKIYAAMVDAHNTAIHEAIIREAEEAGFTDVYLLDKTFIMDAIKEKLENDGYWPKTNPYLQKEDDNG